MTDADTVRTIYLVGGSIFILGLLLSLVTTGGRVLYLVRQKRRRPELLYRDLVVMGGLAASFVLIASVRLLPPELRSAITSGNVLWAAATTLPAVVAVLVYLYFELFVIRREGTNVRELRRRIGAED